MRQLTAFLDGENRAVGADCKADAFCRRAAEQFDEAIVTAAAANGVLRAKPCGGDFERGTRVIVEAADEAPIFFVSDVAERQFVFQLRKMGAASFAQMIGNARQSFDDRLLFG